MTEPGTGVERERVPSWRGVFRNPFRLPTFFGLDLTTVVPGGPTGVALATVGGTFMLVLLGDKLGITFGQPWLARIVVLPLFMGWASSQRAQDGCGALSHVRTTLRALLAPVVRSREPGCHGRMLPVTWDHSAPCVLPGKVQGPARVAFRQPVLLRHTRHGLEARPDQRGEPGTVVLASLSELRVKP